MSTGRKTKVLKFNLYERGRKRTGIDRSNVDMNMMIDIINHPETQERVALGDMLGYFGHEIRQRFGMIPPDAVTLDGKVTPLLPAFKTIFLKAYPNGDVEHQAEFFSTTIGEHARQQYEAKVGGFSQAVTYKQLYNGNLNPHKMFGFDYVTIANFITNVGDGVLFDGLCLPEVTDMICCFDSATDVNQLPQTTAMIANLLEQKIFQTYDNINTQMQLSQLADNALNQVEELNHQIFSQEARKKRQEERQRDIYTGMVGEIKSFDSAIQEADRYMDLMNDQNGQSSSTQQTQQEKTVSGKVVTFFRKMF